MLTGWRALLSTAHHHRGAGHVLFNAQRETELPDCRHLAQLSDTAGVRSLRA